MTPKGKPVLLFSSLPSDNSHIHVTIWLSNRRVKMRYEKKHYVTKGDNKPKSAPELHHECPRVTTALTVPHVGSLTLPKICKDSKIHREFSVSKSSTIDNICYGHLPKLCFSFSFSSSTLSVKWSWYSSKSLLC